jgi:hypothetical protein
MLHLDSFPMWLATIESSRVAEHVRPKLVKYQKECARVLRDHFFGTQVVTPTRYRPNIDDDREDRRLSVESARIALETARLIIETAACMETLSPTARDALRVKALEPTIKGDVTQFLPKLAEHHFTITKAAELFGVSSVRAGYARKAAGIVNNIAGVCEIRLSKSQHSDKQVEQTFLTSRGVAMLGAQLVKDGHITIDKYEEACEKNSLPRQSS